MSRGRKSILTEFDKSQMRMLLKDGVKIPIIAKKLGVSSRTIWRLTEKPKKETKCKHTAQTKNLPLPIGSANQLGLIK